jgi:hypothetical protein
VARVAETESLKNLGSALFRRRLARFIHCFGIAAHAWFTSFSGYEIELGGQEENELLYGKLTNQQA